MSNVRAGGFKKVTKVAAPDGSLHDSHKAAVEHMREVFTKEALAQFASLDPSDENVVHVDDRGNACVYVDQLPAFLLAHRASILVALNQQVPVRKARVKKPKVVGAAE